MTREDILQTFDRMRVWQRGDRRAVHKPLLVLLALARVGAGATAMMDWNEAEPRLKELLDEFGPDGSANSRHYPFWHLQTDGLWQLEDPASILARPPSATPTLTELRNNHVLAASRPHCARPGDATRSLPQPSPNVSSMPIFRNPFAAKSLRR